MQETTDDDLPAQITVTRRPRDRKTVSKPFERTSAGIRLTNLLPMAAAATGSPRDAKILEKIYQNPGAPGIFPCACSATHATRYIYGQQKHCKKRTNIHVQIQNRAFSYTMRREFSGPRRRRAGCPCGRTCARLTHSLQPPGLKRRRPNTHSAPRV